jgi:glucose/mannose-6-phosphate isomerase
MRASISQLPQQCEDAWGQAQGIELPDAYRQATRLVIVGVGGSAIGGDLLRTLVTQECPIPVLVHRDYVLPSFVDSHTLVIICSYSGNTEEALAGFDGAMQRGARLLSLTTGGELERRSRELGLPLCSYHYESQPRAALGYSLIFLLGALQALGWVGDQSGHVTEAVSVMRRWQAEIEESVSVAENPAKQLAQKLHQRLPVVYAAEHLSEVARRWKGQFNENSKSWAVFDTLPELNHNTVVGYPLPPALSGLAHVLMLTSSLNHPRVLLRFDITRELLRRDGYVCDVVQARGESKLAQVLSTVHFGDYVSYYLAMLNGVDPWSIGNIEFVKDRLSIS